MIEGQRQDADRADGNEVAVLHLDNDWPFLHTADAQDGDLRLVDDRRSEETAEYTGIRDRESATLHVVGAETLCARAFAEVVHRFGETEDVFFVGVLDDRHDQTPIECDGDADVVIAVIDDVALIHRCVDDRPLAKAGDDRLYDERHVGELRASLGIAVLVLAAKLVATGAADLATGARSRGDMLRV